MSISSRIALVALVVVVPACSLQGLDRVSLPSCADDNDCAALLSTVADPRCDTFVCVPETGRCVPARVDADRDGETPIECGGTDCADDDSTRFAGATELCNGIDDDCDTHFDGPDEDDDDDGHVDLCAGLALADDCDDDDPRTYVGASELCDGLDNDCTDPTGVIRQGGGRRADPSEDRDEDGHAASSGATCVPPELGDDPTGLFPLDDCDDARGEVYTAALELCDGVDNDCDGVPDDLDGTTAPGTTCRPVGLLAGGQDTCVRTREGDLVCWGDNRLGQLADPSAPGDAAVVIDAARGLTGISFGGAGACGITPDRQVVCWGSGYLFGRVFRGGATNRAPTRIDGVADVVEVSVGTAHACALTSTGGVRCWGYSHPGPIVDGDEGHVDSDYTLAPSDVIGLTDVVEIDAGGTMSCARRSSGEVWCWGFNFAGLLGTGDDGIQSPRPVVGLDGATRVAVGGQFACATRGSGELWCWGDNVGCLEWDCAPALVRATRVPLDGTLADLALGGRHACVLYDDGRFGCWGDNSTGQLALDPAAMSPAGLTSPRTSAEGGVLGLAVGAAHTCVRREGGVRCWGDQSARALGDGRAASPGPPFSGANGVPVSVTANAMQIVGSAQATCFRLPDLTVVCSGTPEFEELGGSSPPFSVPGTAFGTEVVDVALGAFRSLVVRRDGRLNAYGSYSYAAAPDADLAGFVMGVSGVIDATCGDQHSCFADRDGRAFCFGFSGASQLGDGSVASDTCISQNPCSRTPLPVVGLDRVAAIEAGARHTCALRRDGSVWCWGVNARGQTGSLPLGSTAVATPVEGLPTGDPAVQLALGGSFSCALVASGQVWCWGEGLGPLAASFSVDPLPLEGAANVAQIAATRGALCVRQRSGVVRCVGANDQGQLGDGTRDARGTLGTALGVTDARDLGCGDAHCCATRRGGQTVCWGDGAQGQLGVGDLTDRLVPTSVASMLWQRM